MDKEYSWRVYPAKERLGAAIAASVVISTITIVIYFSFHSLFLSILSLIILLCTLNRFYLPSHFVLNQEGITARYPLRQQRYYWTEIRRFISDKHGGYLSTRTQSSRLDAFFGMNILFDNQREAVIERIQKLIRESK